MQNQSFTELLDAELSAIRAALLEKNAAYGNSALEPIRVFSRASADEQLRVRLDDKLSRLRTGRVDHEDTIADLIGYLLLLRIFNAMNGLDSPVMPMERQR